MFDRLDGHLGVRQSRSQLNARQVVDRRGDLQAAQIGSAKANSEISWRRLEPEIDFVAGVKTYSDAGNMAAKRTLDIHEALRHRGAFAYPSKESARRISSRRNFVTC